MNSKDRIELFLKYQSENMSFEDISKKLEVKPTTLRRSLNKYGYKSNNGIYEKEIQKSCQIKPLCIGHANGKTI